MAVFASLTIVIFLAQGQSGLPEYSTKENTVNLLTGSTQMVILPEKPRKDGKIFNNWECHAVWKTGPNQISIVEMHPGMLVSPVTVKTKPWNFSMAVSREGSAIAFDRHEKGFWYLEVHRITQDWDLVFENDFEIPSRLPKGARKAIDFSPDGNQILCINDKDNLLLKIDRKASKVSVVSDLSYFKGPQAPQLVRWLSSKHFFIVDYYCQVHLFHLEGEKAKEIRMVIPQLGWRKPFDELQFYVDEKNKSVTLYHIKPLGYQECIHDLFYPFFHKSRSQKEILTFSTFFWETEYLCKVKEVALEGAYNIPFFSPDGISGVAGLYPNELIFFTLEGGVEKRIGYAKVKQPGRIQDGFFHQKSNHFGYPTEDGTFQWVELKKP